MNRPESKLLRDWISLDADEQTGSGIAFGHWLDGPAPTCPMETTLVRFSGWLAQRGGCA